MGKHRNGQLSPRREKFSQEMVKTGNASEAARRAGYAKPTANREGSRLMKNDQVQARIDEIQAQALDAEDITAELIAKALLHEALTAESDAARVSALGKLANWRGMNSFNFTENTEQVDLHKVVDNLAADNPELRATLLALIPTPDGVDLVG